MPLHFHNSRIKLSQGTIFWREVGYGPAIVFLHGSQSDSNQWVSVMERLATQYRCFAPDLLGFGDSERPNSLHYSINLEVECLAEYMEALSLESVYLVAHSLGAWVAASYALKNLEKVAALVLLEPEGVRAEVKQKTPMGHRWLTWARLIIYIVLRSLYPLAAALRLGKPIERSLSKLRSLQQNPVASQLLFKRRPAEIESELLNDRLPLLELPALILQGEGDMPAIAARCETLVELAPQAKLQVISPTTKDFPEAEPEIAAQLIGDWIAANRQSYD
ncbi:MAG: alpha/beta hydrolase [Oscillatoria sp. SIO1A7]|nr:alpha/beta hydrolase [Oscillatoria sp. SIO1A7]